MRRFFSIASAGVLFALVWTVRPAPESLAFARQGSDKKSEKSNPDEKKKGEKGERDSKESHSKRSDAQFVAGDLLRPMLAEGETGPFAVEEGSFSLRPGDMLELECDIPRNADDRPTFQVEDEDVIQMIPSGVRRVVHLAMVGGSPKPITGRHRYSAIFQARKEGETMVRLNLGRRRFQYSIKVRKKEEDGGEK